jgi:hypothetical protein
MAAKVAHSFRRSRGIVNHDGFLSGGAGALVDAVKSLVTWSFV